MRKNVALFLVLPALLAGCKSPIDDTSIQSHIVTKVVDGDTIQLDDGSRVRFIGIDTPERGQCGYSEATNNLKTRILSKRIVIISDGKQTTDRYGRLLRYVELGREDIGLEQINDGYAHARYDSEDGYPNHSREDKYRTADANSKDYCP